MHGNIENIYNKDAINGIMTNLGYSVYIFLCEIFPSIYGKIMRKIIKNDSKSKYYEKVEFLIVGNFFKIIPKSVRVYRMQIQSRKLRTFFQE